MVRDFGNDLSRLWEQAVSQEDGSDLDPSGRMAAGNRGGLKDGAPDVICPALRCSGLFLRLHGSHFLLIV